MLEDLAVLTGGQVISEELGIKLENVTINDLGSCKKVRLTKKIQLLLAALVNLQTLKLDANKSKRK